VCVEQQRVVDARDLGQTRVLIARVPMHADAADHGSYGRSDDAGRERSRSIERDPAEKDVGDEPEARGLGVPPQAGGEHGER